MWYNLTFDQPLHLFLLNKNQLYGIEHLLQNVVVCVEQDGDVRKDMVTWIIVGWALMKDKQVYRE